MDMKKARRIAPAGLASLSPRAIDDHVRAQ
jgi:hypothetical protein